MSEDMMQDEGGDDPRVGSGQGREGAAAKRMMTKKGGQGRPKVGSGQGVWQPLGLGLAEAKKN
jgi:hypothetical protein